MTKPLAEADNAFVRENFQQGPVAIFRAEGGRDLNVGDLHVLAFAGKHRKRDSECAEAALKDGGGGGNRTRVRDRFYRNMLRA